MFFKFVLIFVILTIQNSNSFRKSAEIPGDCKDVECIEKLLRDRLKKEVTTPSGKMKHLLNTWMFPLQGYRLTDGGMDGLRWRKERQTWKLK